jgi:hypothetical protein
MAIIQPSGIISSITGKFSGAVIQGGKGGLQLRTRVVPRNPRTNFQAIARNRFAFYSSIWTQIDPVTQQEWRDATDTEVTGNALFCQCNVNANLIGLEGVSFWIQQADPQGMQFEITSITTSLVEITCTGMITTVPANCRLLIEISKQQPGSRFFNSPGSYANTIWFEELTDMSTATDITAAVLNRFNTITLGKSLSIRLAVISKDNGRRSVQYIQTAVIS